MWILHESPPTVLDALLVKTVWMTRRLNSPAFLMSQCEIKLLLGSVIWFTPRRALLGSSHTVEFKHGPRTSFQSSLALCIRHQLCLKISKLCWLLFLIKVPAVLSSLLCSLLLPYEVVFSTCFDWWKCWFSSLVKLPLLISRTEIPWLPACRKSADSKLLTPASFVDLSAIM